MSVRIERSLAGLAGALAMAAACSSSAGTAAHNAPAQPGGSATATPAVAASCWAGPHAVRSITGHQTVDTPLGPAKPSGTGGSLVLDVGVDGQWSLSSDGATPVAFDVGGLTATVAINGSVRGRYTRAGAQFVFEQRSADGTMVLHTAAGSQQLSISNLGPALAPDGAATLTCQPDRVVMDSASVTMELVPTAVAQAGPAAGGTAPPAAAPPPGTAPPAAAPPPAAPPTAAPPAAQPLVFTDSAKDLSAACAGRPVMLRGSQNRVHLTGDCPTVEIVGSQNTVSVERVDEITVTGSFNHVDWASGINRSQPAVHSTGTDDVVQHAG
jgi:Protein of unknown function (DUF3060)